MFSFLFDAREPSAYFAASAQILALENGLARARIARAVITQKMPLSIISEIGAAEELDNIIHSLQSELAQLCLLNRPAAHEGRGRDRKPSGDSCAAAKK